jgi:hypothetical protein
VPESNGAPFPLRLPAGTTAHPSLAAQVIQPINLNDLHSPAGEVDAVGERYSLVMPQAVRSYAYAIISDNSS